MDDFAEKVVLALVAFFLGLLADVIKKAFGRERRRIKYSINKEPIISVSQNLPSAVLAKLPTDQTVNVICFRVLAENTGTQSVKDVNLLVVANQEAELIYQDISTNPPREVHVPTTETQASNEIRFKGISLERKQSIAFNLFLKSRIDASIETFWSGGDNVELSLTSAVEEFGLEEHVVAIIRNYIFAEFVPVLFSGIFLLLAAFVSYSGMSLERWTNTALMGGQGLSQMLGSLLRFYFYLRIVPHAVAIVRYILRSRPTVGK